jgi:hypothetical protein
MSLHLIPSYEQSDTICGYGIGCGASGV